MKKRDDAVRKSVRPPKERREMDLWISLGLFLACVAGCMAAGRSLAWALLVGFFCFFAVSLRRGWKARELLSMAADGMRTSMRVLWILLALGLLTALWRAGGTVALFVWGGLQLVTPGTFILVAFLLSSVFSLAFGSSFGVVGTAGVILMSIARSGGADPVITAGAVMSGIYVGERLSPASSSAALTAAVCGVDQNAFQRRMWRTTLLPMLLTVAVYGVLSALNPIRQVDAQIVSALEEGFCLSWPAAIPAVALLALPWMKVSALKAILVSCVLSAMSALLLQGMEVPELIRVCMLGYRPKQEMLANIMSGGGLISMANVVVIVVLSCSYSGIFSGTGLLAPVTQGVGRIVERIGLFGSHVVIAIGACVLFCNQTVGVVMSAQLMEEEYRRQGKEPMEMAENIGNSVINLAGLVPWAIASSVPLAAMEVGPEVLPLAVYLYLLPLCCWAGSWRKGKKRKPVGKTKI